MEPTPASHSMRLTALRAAVATAFHVVHRHRERPELVRPAILVAVLAALQILLGGITVWTSKSIVPTTFHVLNGALILATSLILTLRSFRVLRPQRTGVRLESFAERQVAT